MRNVLQMAAERQKAGRKAALVIVIRARILGLQSGYRGRSKDYLVWGTLGILMREGKMVRAEGSRRHKAVE